MADHIVQGRRIAMPVEVRDAAACSAMFAVPATAARSVIAYSGLRLVEPVPGRALCSLAFVRYLDGDLGAYHEFAVAFLVRPPAGHGRVATFIHWLPVDQSFTRAAGREIWGFPKELSDIEAQVRSRDNRCVLRQDGQLVVDLRIRAGVPVPSGSARTSFDAYTYQNGVTRRTPWGMHPEGVRSRPGGALIRLGDHPVADELRTLGLPRRALFTSTIHRLRMTFADAEEIR